MKKKLAVVLAVLMLLGCASVPAVSNQEISATASRIFVSTERARGVILSRAADSQVVIFGETHMTHTADSEFVISMLEELKAMGYEYLAFESPRNPRGDNNHGFFHDFIVNERDPEDLDSYRRLKFEGAAGGWIDLALAAREHGFKIVCYDERGTFGLDERDKRAFSNIKEMIFKEDPDAKVIVYAGVFHTSEEPYLVEGNKNTRVIAWYLDRYTQGRCLSVCLANVYAQRYRESFERLKSKQGKPIADIYVDIGP